MFAIELINFKGGSCIAVAKTLAACRQRAADICAAFPVSYCASTIPYAIYKRCIHPYPNVPDATIPFEIQKSIGMELRLTYKDIIEYIGKS
jgi:hypothetical protein